MSRRTVGILAAGVVLLIACSHDDGSPVLRGPYLGQEPPGRHPKIFAPGIVSTGFTEQFAHFTPDGKEIYWLLRGAPHTVVLYMKEGSDGWTKPRVAPFSGRYFAKMCLSPDGNRVVLTSTQPRSGHGEPTDILTTWIVERTDTGWGELRLVEPLRDAAAPTISRKGNLYFYLDIEDERDIYVSEFANGTYAEPRKLSAAVNSEFDEVDPFVSPDESYIIYGASGPQGDGLYVSFRNKDGSWRQAVNMSHHSDIPPDANCASVTPDGRYLFFTSWQRSGKSYSEEPITHEDKVRVLTSPGNGSADIYWVDAAIIDELRPQE